VYRTEQGKYRLEFPIPDRPTARKCQSALYGVFHTRASVYGKLTTGTKRNQPKHLNESFLLSRRPLPQRADANGNLPPWHANILLLYNCLYAAQRMTGANTYPPGISHSSLDASAKTLRFVSLLHGRWGMRSRREAHLATSASASASSMPWQQTLNGVSGRIRALEDFFFFFFAEIGMEISALRLRG